LVAKLADVHVVTSDMKLSPNVGSDRSWVWNVHADYADGEPTAETLAIRFGNSESKYSTAYCAVTADFGRRQSLQV